MTVVVAAGVLRNYWGQTLIGERVVAGRTLSEFPGGKAVAGESPHAALVRELDEELGIRVEVASPLHSVPFALRGRSARLDAFVVERWRGEVIAREGQPLRWVDSATLPAIDWLPPDVPLLAALRLPRVLAITPDATTIESAIAAVARVIDAGARCIQLRMPSLADAAFRDTAAHALERARSHPAAPLVILNREPAIALELGCDGVHLSRARLFAARERPLPRGMLMTAACHDVAAMVHAVKIGCNALLVSPLRSTATHADALPIGWDGFERIARRSPLPCFALGGLTPADLPRARERGGFGVAGIRGFV